MGLDEKLLEIYVSKSHVEKNAIYLILAAFFGVIATILSASSENPLIQKFPVLTIMFVMITISLTLLYLINAYHEHKWNYQHLIIRLAIEEFPANGSTYEKLIDHIEKVTLFERNNVKKILFKYHPPENFIIVEQTPKKVIAGIIILLIIFIFTIGLTYNI